MKASLYLQKAGNLFLENRILKFAIVVLGLAVAINSLFVYRAVKYQKVILIPPRLTGTVEFVQGQPSDNYVKDLARRITNLCGTYSPANARAQFAELLAMYDPESYPTASEAWYNLAGQIEDARVSTVFYLDHLKLIKSDGIEASGTVHQFTNDMPLETKPQTFLITYRLVDGKFQIRSISHKM